MILVGISKSVLVMLITCSNAATCHTAGLLENDFQPMRIEFHILTTKQTENQPIKSLETCSILFEPIADDQRY